MSLAIACLCRNEATKWFPSVLSAWESFASIIVALDDGSTDGTKELLASNSKVLLRHRYGVEPAWGNEAPARRQLWELAVKESQCDWIMVLDADMVPAKDIRPLLDAPVDGIAFRLHDLWSLKPLTYRDDGFWRGHMHPRLWVVRNPWTVEGAEWNDRGIHCGHFPVNLNPARILIAPPEYSLLHLAYSDPEARAAKYAQYQTKFAQMSMEEINHAHSIMDNNVSLQMLPFGVQWPLTKF